MLFAKKIRYSNCLALVSAFLLGYLATVTAPRGATAQDFAANSRPPVAPVRPVVDDYFGTKVADPYRYMENLNDPEVAAWMRAQNAYTRGVLAHIRGRDELLVRIEQLDESVPARVGEVKRLSNGRCFYLKSLSKDSVFKLYMRDGMGGPEKLLVDPGELGVKNDTPYAVNYFSPSDDGRYVAYGVSPGGSEKAVLHILDTVTMHESGETIDRVEFGQTIGWRADGRSFFYNRLQKLRPNAPEEEKEIKSRVFLHVIGADSEHDVAIFGYGVSDRIKLRPADIPFIATFPGVPVAFASAEQGSDNEIVLYEAPLNTVGKGNTPWRRICGVEDGVTDMAVRGDDLWLLTHKGASHFKIIHTHVRNPDLSHADVVLPPGEMVILSMVAAQDALYVQVRDAAVHRLLRIPYEPGSKPEQIALPFEGSIEVYAADARVRGVVFMLTGWTKAERVYEYDPRTKSVVDTKLRLSGQFDDPADIESQEVKVKGQDGTWIPLSIVHRRGLKLDGSNPTVLYGYGAYGDSSDPTFEPNYLAWLERGGVFAYAHVRGGGEYGNDWHTGGQKLTKPNTWRDFIACAEYLVEKKYTSPGRLAGQGISAGGVLIGRAITERPELFAAALIEVGFTDALRGELEESGPGDILEWGTVKEPDGFKGLYEMSAYAHVKNGTPYPAAMLITGINDPRVAPWEPAKMTARLQAASTSGKPILLRVDYEAGHGVGSTRKQVEEQLADEWTFLFWQLVVAGFQPTAGDGRQGAAQ
jgi:prolyl oligopeptidase